MSATKWQRPGFISLLDEIERRGRERYGAEWPQPPTEDDIRAEGEVQFENARRNYRPSGGPALPGDGPRDISTDAVIGKTLDEFMGPDLRTVEDGPFAKLFALNASQTVRRNNIERELHEKYKARRREMTIEITNEIRSDLFQGTISAIYERELRDVEIDRMWWRLPEAEAAFMTGSHAGFEILLKIGRSAKSTPSKNNVRVECQKWLEGLRHDNPAGYPPDFRDKDSFRDEAVKRFKGLTDSGFDSAWLAAANAVPLSKTSGWGKSGRKRGKPAK